jgi:hypothetical protein
MSYLPDDLTRLKELFAGARALPPDARPAYQPQWSPHGHRIVYWGRPGEAGQRDLWTVAPTGGAAVPVTNDAPTDWNPVWSPDGRSLFSPAIGAEA